MSNPGAVALPEVRTERKGLLATGGLIGAALASSCCILPLLLLTLGVSGAWIGRLTALAPYQPVFLLATGGFLAAGFWAVYRRPGTTCEPDSYCASPRSDRVAKAALWTATALVGAAVGVNLLAPLFL
jgi:mercuric ion transport protein